MFTLRTLLNTTATLMTVATVAACASNDSPTAPIAEPAVLAADGGAGILATIRVRCELRRSGPRSDISVDGNNLRPLNARWSARVRSGGVIVNHPVVQGVGDEAEFDFSSDPGDIGAGAQPIPGNYIKVNPTGPDVFAQILDASGRAVVTGAADCLVR